MPNVNIKTPAWLREMENILEELNEGVAIVDDQLRIIFANEALTRLWQYDLDELRGCAPDALFPSEDLSDFYRDALLVAGLRQADGITQLPAWDVGAALQAMDRL